MSARSAVVKSIGTTCSSLYCTKEAWKTGKLFLAFPFQAGSYVWAAASVSAADWPTLEACRYDVMHRRQWARADRACGYNLFSRLSVVAYIFT